MSPPMSTGPQSDFGRAPAGPRDVAAAGLIVLFCVAVQASFDRVVGSDGFFHVRQAERVLTGGMPWMPDSVFTAGWVDHQLGLHLLMWPLATVLPGITAVKAAGALFAAAGLIGWYAAARRLRLPAPLALALLPATSWLVLLRLEMPRAQGVSLLLLGAALVAIVERRPRWLAAVAFAYAWTYQVALVLLPIAALHAVVLAARRTPDWRLPLAAAGGLLAGFAIHPHSPGTFRFLWQHVVLKVLNDTGLPVGLEWSDGSVESVLLRGAVGVVALGLALLRGRRSAESWTLQLLATGALLAGIAGTKFLEYGVPLSVLALGVALRDSGWRVRNRSLLAVPLSLALLASSYQVRDAVLTTEPPPTARRDAMAFVRGVAEPGEPVFHFHWNDFPELVFWGPEFTYVVGLDPHFLALHNPPKWRLFDALGGAFGDRRSVAIAQAFGARWAVVSLPHPGAREALATDPGLRLVYEDRWALVYAVGQPSE